MAVVRRVIREAIVLEATLELTLIDAPIPYCINNELQINIQFLGSNPSHAYVCGKFSWEVGLLSLTMGYIFILVSNI